MNPNSIHESRLDTGDIPLFRWHNKEKLNFPSLYSCSDKLLNTYRTIPAA